MSMCYPNVHCHAAWSLTSMKSPLPRVCWISQSSRGLPRSPFLCFLLLTFGEHLSAPAEAGFLLLGVTPGLLLLLGVNDGPPSLPAALALEGLDTTGDLSPRDCLSRRTLHNWNMLQETFNSFIKKYAFLREKELLMARNLLTLS